MFNGPNQYVGCGFGVGVATTILTDKLIVPAVKKSIEKKKAAKATVDVNNINAPAGDDKR